MLHMGTLKGLDNFKKFLKELEDSFDNVSFGIFHTLIDNAALEYGKSIESTLSLNNMQGSTQIMSIKQEYYMIDEIFSLDFDSTDPEYINKYDREYLRLSHEDHGHNLGIGVGVCSGEINFQWTTCGGHEVTIESSWRYGLRHHHMIDIEEGRHEQPTNHMEFKLLVGHEESEKFYPIIADLIVLSGGQISGE